MKKSKICDNALKFNLIMKKIMTLKPVLTLENKGFFEKLFEYF